MRVRSVGPYFPTMDDDVSGFIVAPTEQCWSSTKNRMGFVSSCRRPGDYALGLCEEHAEEIVGHPKGKR